MASGTSFPPPGFNAWERNGETVVTKQPKDSSSAQQTVVWMGKAVRISNSGNSGEPSSYLRVEPNDCQQCLADKVSFCCCPPAEVDKVGNVVCCATCTGYCILESGFSPFPPVNCALGCYKCCNCQQLTNCGESINDENDLFKQSWFMRSPSAYTPYGQDTTALLSQRNPN